MRNMDYCKGRNENDRSIRNVTLQEDGKDISWTDRITNDEVLE